ncbi:MAG: lipid-A-disaccharide synthase-related protein [Phormidesmis sp.]
MNLLCISNGHGEDVIARRILTGLRASTPDLRVFALPITGAGSAYQAADIPLIGPTQVLPSGGFLNRDPKQLAHDLQKGLLALTRSQLRAIKAWAKTGDAILAVGDIVPLLFAYLSRLPYTFVGTAKSEYWLRDEQGKLPGTKPWEQLEGWSGSVYLPWERWLMNRDRCRAVFVRDALTARQLQSLGVEAQYAGNPMMDGLSPTGKLTDLLAQLRAATSQAIDQQSQSSVAAELEGSRLNSPDKNGPDKAKATARYVTPKQQTAPLTIALLPGSRQPEAYKNWENMLAAIPGLSQALPNRPLILLAAITPSLSIEKLQVSLSGWQSHAGLYPTFTYQTATRLPITLMLIADAYADCLDQSEIAIATAGTATEQFVGLGKPAVTLPGNGPQFTPAFATVQAKMLGPSVQMVGQADEIGEVIAQIIRDPDRLQLIYQNGKQRMGERGAGDRIAQQLIKAFLVD